MGNLLDDMKRHPRIGECTEENEYKKIVLKDKRTKTRFVVLNKHSKTVYKTEMDGCLMPEGEGIQKCDFMVNQKGAAILLLVELKSKKISRALSQLENSQKYLSRYLPTNYEYKYILVHRGGRSTDLQTIRSKCPIKICRAGDEKQLSELMEVNG